MKFRSDEDPYHSLMCAVLNQAIQDMKRVTPKMLGKLCTRRDRLQGKRYHALNSLIEEYVELRRELLEWPSTEDFVIVVEAAGLSPASVRTVFDGLIAKYQKEV